MLCDCPSDGAGKQAVFSTPVQCHRLFHATQTKPSLLLLQVNKRIAHFSSSIVQIFYSTSSLTHLVQKKMFTGNPEIYCFLNLFFFK